MLYNLAPVANPSASFYMYVEHAKSGTTSEDADRREAEATEVRASADTLGSRRTRHLCWRLQHHRQYRRLLSNNGRFGSRPSQ